MSELLSLRVAPNLTYLLLLQQSPGLLGERLVGDLPVKIRRLNPDCFPRRCIAHKGHKLNSRGQRKDISAIRFLYLRKVFAGEGVPSKVGNCRIRAQSQRSGETAGTVLIRRLYFYYFLDQTPVLQDFVDKFGASATKASQAQSRVKAIERMRKEGKLDPPPLAVTAKRRKPSLALPDPPKGIGEDLISLKK